MADPELDLRLRHRYTRLVAQLLRAVAEEKNELRTHLDLTTKSLSDFDVVLIPVVDTCAHGAEELRRFWV